MEGILILKRIVMLRKWHRAGVKPAVDDLRHPLHVLFAALRAGTDEIVDIRSVKLHRQRILAAGQLSEFLPGADCNLLAAVRALPDRKWCPPVAVSGDAPVLDILQPVTKTALSDCRRDPVDGVVVVDQLLLDRRHPDEPGLARIVDQRRIASPAVRILVLELRRIVQLSLLVEVAQNQRIRLLDEDACIRRLLRQLTLSVDKLHERKIIGLPDSAVVLTKCRCNMNDTGTICHRDIIVAGDIEPLLELLCRRLTCAGVERLILAALQVGSPVGFQNLVGSALRDPISVIGGLIEIDRHRCDLFIGRTGLSELLLLCLRERSRLMVRAGDLGGGRLVSQLAEHLVGQCLGDDIVVAIRSLDLDIGLVRVYAKCHIGRKCPRGGCPCEIVEVILVLCLETDDSRALLDKLVALGHFLRRQRGAAPRTVRDNLEALVQKPLLRDLLQRPPLGLDVVVIVGDVRILHIRPEPDGIGEILPHSLIFPDTFLALFDERLHAVLLDLLLAIETKLLLDAQLDRKAVGVPASLSRHIFALHHVIARNHILDDARQDMTDVRLAVRRRRSVIKCVVWRALAGLQALSEDVILLPELVHLMFAVHKVQVCVYLVISHRIFPPGAPFSSAAPLCADSPVCLNKSGGSGSGIVHIHCAADIQSDYIHTVKTLSNKGLPVVS